MLSVAKITVRMNMKDEAIDLNEAVKLLMSGGKMSRRAAKKLILKALADGKLPATGIVVTKEGFNLGRQKIPPKFWVGAKVK